MSAIWNLLNPIRCGGTNLKLMSSGRELFGTVIKSGKINKTVTVKVDYQFYVRKYKGYVTKSNKFLVHDEENFSRPGDKVVIRSCLPISTRKHYYLRNIVKAFPRNDYYEKEQNPVLDEEYKKQYKSYLDREVEKTVIKNKKDEATLKASVKLKAMNKAIQNLKKLESDKSKK